jgi:hypothetical protein
MPSREWSLERLVNASTTGSQANSKVAALAGGGFVVVWEDGGSTAPIRAQRFDTAGNPVGDEIAIDTGLNEVLPSVADLADGGSAVTWTEDHTGNNYILGKLYSASGAVEHNQPVVFSFGPRRRLGRGVARRRIGGRSGPPRMPPAPAAASPLPTTPPPPSRTGEPGDLLLRCRRQRCCVPPTLRHPHQPCLAHRH